MPWLVSRLLLNCKTFCNDLFFYKQSPHDSICELCEPFTLETEAGSAGQVPDKSGYPFFDDRVVVKAKRVTLFPETIFSHINVALPRSQVFPVYPATQWHLKLLPSTEQVALL